MTKIEFFDNFLKELKQLKKSNKNILKDIMSLEEQLKQNPTQGVSLGYQMYKIRLANSSKRIGKRGGFRVITYFIDENNIVYLASIYDKTEIENITVEELKKIVEQEFKK